MDVFISLTITMKLLYDKDQIISNNKDEIKIIINQINNIQKNILNLKYNNINTLINDSSLNYENNSNNQNIADVYFQKEQRNILNIEYQY